jgi:hypothetical protein
MIIWTGIVVLFSGAFETRVDADDEEVDVVGEVVVDGEKGG